LKKNIIDWENRVNINFMESMPMVRKYHGLGEPTTTVAFKMTVTQRKRLEALAAAERRPLSSFIRNVLEDFMASASAPKAGQKSKVT
jgi:hypothetical protein